MLFPRCEQSTTWHSLGRPVEGLSIREHTLCTTVEIGIGIGSNRQGKSALARREGMARFTLPVPRNLCLKQCQAASCY